MGDKPWKNLTEGYRESIQKLLIRAEKAEAEIERLKEELEVQHARTADQFDRAEKAEAIMDAAREGES